MPRLSAARFLPAAVLLTAAALAVACQQDVSPDHEDDDGQGAGDALPIDDTGAGDDDTGAVDDDTGAVDDDTGAVDDDTGVDDEDTGAVGDDLDAGAGADASTGTGTGGSDAGTAPGNTPGPPPSQTTQSCVEWTDCGPWYVNDNSGFDCDSGQCACDSTGQWEIACNEGGAAWSEDMCFCYWGTTALPSQSPDPEPDDEVYCWWDWWGRDCEPDTWVDTSYYEKVCYGDDCYWEYVDDGYYTDGDCEEQWVSRCSDGTIWRYF